MMRRLRYWLYLILIAVFLPSIASGQNSASQPELPTLPTLPAVTPVNMPMPDSVKVPAPPTLSKAAMMPEQKNFNPEASLLENAFANSKEKNTLQLDIVSRPVYRYDDEIPALELVEDSSDFNTHIPLYLTEEDMKDILFKGVLEEDIQLLKFLRNERSADLNILDDSDNSLLDFAIKNKKYQSIKFLMYHEAISNADLNAYIALSIQNNDVELLEIISNFGLFDKLNEGHFINVFGTTNNMKIISFIYNALDQSELKALFNYYGQNMHVAGLKYMVKQDYDIDQKLKSNLRILENGVKNHNYHKVNQGFVLASYFSHDHIYSAYKMLLAQNDRSAFRVANNLISYGIAYELEHDIRDKEYVATYQIDEAVIPVSSASPSSNEVVMQEVEAQELFDPAVEIKSDQAVVQDMIIDSPLIQSPQQLVERGNANKYLRPQTIKPRLRVKDPIVLDEVLIPAAPQESVVPITPVQELQTPYAPPLLQTVESNYDDFWQAG